MNIPKVKANVQAIKLMEEVGIPNPVVRFHQYPFLFDKDL